MATKIKNVLFTTGLLIVTTGILQLWACKSKSKEEKYVPAGEGYFNYKKGNIREYILDSIDYSWLTNKAVKYHFLVKEYVVDTFTDLTGRVSLRVEQYISRDTGRSYFFYKLNSIFVDGNGVQRVEENQRYVKMLLPIKDKRKWNGNLFNNLGYQDYKYDGVTFPRITSWYNYPDCVKVLQRNDSSFISSNVDFEIYARDFGLVNRYNKNIEYDNVTFKPRGYIMEWVLTKYWEK